MNDFQLPEVTDADIRWAGEVLGLPTDAFFGPGGDDPRAAILKCNETIDVEACPGSGKTTLLVAKLAILSRRWQDIHRGICVVSHTNAARREIERRLGATAAGRQLLTYPHFIGTIHAFIDEFLAMPWLRSLGYPIRVVDDQHCEQHRRRLLNLQQFSTLRNYVAQQESAGQYANVVSGWAVASPEFDVVKRDGTPVFVNQSVASAGQLRNLARKCTEDGYHRFDEMFMWAADLLQHIPEILSHIRYRFPILFIDEVQDNSERQSSFLKTAFTDGDSVVIRQRFGDSNQAIYGDPRETGAASDQFPDASIKRDVPSSYRFGQEIGDLAKPLGVEPQELVGRGPGNGCFSSNVSGQHAVFLFEPDVIQRVLPAYCEHLLGIFSPDELLIGTYTAVAAVHNEGPDDNIPRFLGQYWPEYDPELTSAEPRPQTLHQYITAGRARTEQSGEAHHLVEMVAEGMVRLVRMSRPTTDVGLRKRKHRHILELLAGNAAVRSQYLNLIDRLTLDSAKPSKQEWENEWTPLILSVAESINGSTIDLSSVVRFLEWSSAPANVQAADDGLRDNIYRYPFMDPQVILRVGSIHSVKGETHTATLVLDSFFRTHHLAALKPWLLGAKSGGHGESATTISRLKQHYVAMTRPSHLVCLALREDVLSAEEVTQVKARGWRVAHVTEGPTEWL